MTQQQNENVLAWLKDAHAMEQGGVLTLENHAAAAQNYPEVQSKLHAHAETTRHHADLVGGCIERLGGRPSALKEVIGTVIGKVQGIANLPAQDTVVKNALGDLAAESFEIASYRSLIAAAERIGDHETANVCRQILRDEEEMADWLAQQIPVITQRYLAEQTGEAGSGGRAQIVDRAKQKAQELNEQAKELASKAKQKGQGVPAQVVDKAKELAEGLEERGEALASKAKQRSKDAIIASGALLVGAGVGMLVVQALRKGSDKKQRVHEHNDNVADSKDVYNDVRAGYVDGDAGEGSEGLSVQPNAALDLGSETLDLGEPFMQNAELSTEQETQPEDASSELPRQTAEPSGIPGFQSQEQTTVDFLGSDRNVIDTASMRNDVQSMDDALLLDTGSIDAESLQSDVRDMDELASLDTDPIIDDLMSDDAQSADELSSLDAASVGDVELLADDARDVDELSSLDAGSREAELMSSDAQSDLQDEDALAYSEVWLIPGPYSGVGPTGYDNSGDPTGQEVYSRLTQHGQIDASNIEIVIDNGEVLLDGAVNSEEAKRLAQEAVETIAGVSTVQNLLRVQANQDG